MLGFKPSVGKPKGNGTARGSRKNPAGNVLDVSKAPHLSFGHGRRKNKPKRCLVCHQAIRDGADWRKYTPEEHPGYGRYSFIVHAQCC